MELQNFLGRLSGDTEKDVKTLANFVFQQNEEMRYLLNNLDVTNFNDLGLARYENGRMQLYAEQVEIRARTLEAVLKDTTDELGGRITTLQATADGLQVTVEGHTGRLNGLDNTTEGLQNQITTVKVTADGLQTTVSGHTISIANLSTKSDSLQSQITQNKSSIALVVSGNSINAASIVSAINGSTSTVKISADKVNITGLVTISDLKTAGSVTINGGNITAGTISGVTLKSEGTRSWEKVTIESGIVKFYSGEIQDWDTGTLEVYANTTLRLRAGGKIYLYVGGGGKAWRIGSDGIYFCDADGNAVSYVPTQAV